MYMNDSILLNYSQEEQFQTEVVEMNKTRNAWSIRFFSKNCAVYYMWKNFMFMVPCIADLYQ